MAVFSTDEVNDQPLDWKILRDGGVALYWRPEILGDDLNWLELNGYQVVSFEAAAWLSEDQMHWCLKTDLLFPDYYGENLDALDECMCDDLAVPSEGGLALVLKQYDHFARALPQREPPEKSYAEIVLDIFARAVRIHMLLGKRLIILVQSDDPSIHFGRLGGVGATWNWREWLNKDRGLAK